MIFVEIIQTEVMHIITQWSSLCVWVLKKYQAKL